MKSVVIVFDRGYFSGSLASEEKYQDQNNQRQVHTMTEKYLIRAINVQAGPLINKINDRGA